MTAQQIATYQRIRARILAFRKPMYVRPLTPFQRAVLAATIYANASR